MENHGEKINFGNEHMTIFIDIISFLKWNNKEYVN